MPDRLSIALGVYDRTLPLIAGLTPIEGVEPAFVCDPLESIFHRAFDEVAFDVSELSFSNFLYLTAAGTCPYVGIPIFPSRSYRHSIVYVRTDRAIASAKVGRETMAAIADARHPPILLRFRIGSS